MFFLLFSVIPSPKNDCEPSVCRILDGGPYGGGRQEPVGCPGEPEGVRGEEAQSDIGGCHAFAHVGNVWLALFLHDRPKKRKKKTQRKTLSRKWIQIKFNLKKIKIKN